MGVFWGEFLINIFDYIENKNISAIEVHDASPKYQKELKLIFNELDKKGLKENIIAIVPNWAGQFDIRKYPEFIQMIKEREKAGAELVLHGLTHKTGKNAHWYDFLFGDIDGWEFRDLNYNESKEKLIIGKKIFKEVFGYYPKGFIPPNWRISKGALEAVKDEGFEYVSSIRQIKYFKKRWLKSKTAFFDFGKNSKLIKWVYKNQITLKILRFSRVAIHPNDMNMR